MCGPPTTTHATFSISICHTCQIPNIWTLQNEKSHPHIVKYVFRFSDYSFINFKFAAHWWILNPISFASMRFFMTISFSYLFTGLSESRSFRMDLPSISDGISNPAISRIVGARSMFNTMWGFLEKHIQEPGLKALQWHQATKATTAHPQRSQIWKILFCDTSKEKMTQIQYHEVLWKD